MGHQLEYLSEVVPAISHHIEVLYELQDTTRFRSIGLFPSLADAIAAIDAMQKPWLLSQGRHELCFADLRIVKRRWGLDENGGKEVWHKRWYRSKSNEWTDFANE